MQDDKNNLRTEPAPDAQNQALDERDLENVSGGFTLIDTCRKQWSPAICYDAIWGACPHLSITRLEEKHCVFHIVITHSVSCAKGYFKDKIYDETID